MTATPDSDDRRLKLLIVTTTFPGEPGDGTPSFVADLTEGLSDRADITVICPRRRVSDDSFFPWARVVRVPYWFRRYERLTEGAMLANMASQPVRALQFPFLCLSMWRAIRREISTGQPDVIHAHWVIPMGLLATFFGRRRRTPVVITCHGVDLHAMKIAPLEWLRRVAFRRAAAVTTVSTELAVLAGALGAAEPVLVIPMGTDLTTLANSPEPERVHDQVSFVGRLVAKKGVDILLRSLVITPDLHCRIAGDGPLRSELEAMSRELGVADRVEFLGSISREEVLSELQTAAAVAIPSVTAPNGDRDGTPVVLAEAVATNTPIVASDVGGLGELLTSETGWVVPSGDHEALALALKEATSGNEGTRRARLARDRVLPHLDIARTVEQYERLFKATAV